MSVPWEKGAHFFNMFLYECYNVQFAQTGFDPDDHPWKDVNATEFISETAHQLDDFIDRYKIS